MAIDIYGNPIPTPKPSPSERPLEAKPAPSPAATAPSTPTQKPGALSLEKDYSGDEEKESTGMGTEYPYYANTGQVMLGYVGTTAPTGSPRPVYSNVYEQEQYLKSLRGAMPKSAEARQEYESIVALLRNRGYLGSRSRATPSNVDQAWKDLQEDANLALEQGVQTTPLDILTGGGGDRDALGVGGSGRGGPRTTTSVSLSSPEDIETALQEAARDMIGRSLNDQELAKYMKKYQRQEAAAVTTTTSTSGGSVTQQGTSKAEILRRIMANNPDFAAYQIDTEFMDMFADSISEGQAVINAGR